MPAKGHAPGLCSMRHRMVRKPLLNVLPQVVILTPRSVGVVDVDSGIELGVGKRDSFPQSQRILVRCMLIQSGCILMRSRDAIDKQPNMTACMGA